MAVDPAEGDPPAPVGPRANRRAKSFRELFDALPADIQDLARKAFRQFVADPSHPALRHHRLKDTKAGQHTPGSFSVSVNRQYRAVYVEVGDINLWYWIGTHAAYNRFTGKGG